MSYLGGEPAWHGEFPAKISLQTRGGNHFCGGALIGSIKKVLSYQLPSNYITKLSDLRHVLTAAHCLTTTFGAVLNPDNVKILRIF